VGIEHIEDIKDVIIQALAQAAKEADKVARLEGIDRSTDGVI